MVPAVTTAICVHGPVTELACSTLNPLSFVELSVHDTSMEEGDVAVAVTSPGVAGAAMVFLGLPLLVRVARLDCVVVLAVRLAVPGRVPW